MHRVLQGQTRLSKTGASVNKLFNEFPRLHCVSWSTRTAGSSSLNVDAGSQKLIDTKRRNGSVGTAAEKGEMSTGLQNGLHYLQWYPICRLSRTLKMITLFMDRNKKKKKLN